MFFDEIESCRSSEMQLSTGEGYIEGISAELDSDLAATYKWQCVRNPPPKNKLLFTYGH